MKYSLEQLQALAAQTGFPDPILAAAVAMAESGGDTCAQGDPNIGVHSCDGPNGTSKSFGLWQVHVDFHPQYDPKSLLNPNYNAQAALAISRNGTYWRPWSAFKNGSYLKYYPLAVYPPNGAPPIIPQPVTPPTESKSILGVVAGAVALVGATGYGVYKLISSRRRQEFRYYFPPEPES